MVCVWKLNGERCPPAGGPIVASLASTGVPVDEAIGDPIEPKLLNGNVAVIGESAFVSKEMLELTIWFAPLISNVSLLSGMGVGGVGVRGGAGIGRLEAMADIYGSSDWQEKVCKQ